VRVALSLSNWCATYPVLVESALRTRLLCCGVDSEPVPFGEPPGFESDGTAPPLRSEAVLLEVVNVEIESSSRQIEVSFGAFGAISMGGVGRSKNQSVTRRALHWRYWARDDPITTAAPGASFSKSLSVKVGLSQSTARELCAAFGVQGLEQVSAKFSVTTTLALEQEVTRSVTLEGGRRYAIWHPVRRIIVEERRNDGWLELKRFDYVENADWSTTSWAAQ
jgi:hypothetical protein